MKIVRIVSELDFGGVERRLVLTALAFKQNDDHELIFLVLGKTGRMAKEIQELGYSILSLNQNPKIPNFGLIHSIFKNLKDIQPDVVHTSGSEANFHGLWASRWAKVPARIGEEIGFPNHHGLWKSLFRITYATAHRIIAISEAVKENIVKLGEVSDVKVSVVYNPVGIRKDLAVFEVPKAATSKFIFITTCRLVAVKNLKSLIEAFKLLTDTNPHRNIDLWILGEGNEEESLKIKVRSLGLQDRVLFKGFQKNVVPFLMNSNSFILPSFSEGFSISLVEAMACGLPVIATNVGGPSEIIYPGTGFLVNPQDVSDISNKMQMVLGMSEKNRRTMGKNAKIMVNQRFSIEKYKSNLLSLYDHLLS